MRFLTYVKAYLGYQRCVFASQFADRTSTVVFCEFPPYLRDVPAPCSIVRQPTMEGDFQPATENSDLIDTRFAEVQNDRARHQEEFHATPPHTFQAFRLTP